MSDHPVALAPAPTQPGARLRLDQRALASSQPPAWVESHFAGVRRLSFSPRRASRYALHRETRDAGGVCLTSLVVEDALLLDAADFESATACAYQELLDGLETIPARYPLRVWNFIPEILSPLGDHPHRYMAFNAGRFAAYRRRHGTVDSFPSTLATASGTGHWGTGLVIHCLSSVAPGRPIENPRQVPAYRYSERWGPYPPCFARATVATFEPDQRELILVGGTASVRGEDSEHPGDLDAQIVETVFNLEALVAAAQASEQPDHGDGALARFRHLRVYFPKLSFRSQIAAAIESRFAPETLEFLHCDLCRPELLIEIEGVAEI